MRHCPAYLCLLAAFVLSSSAESQSGNPDAEKLLEMHQAGLKAHLDQNVDALLADQADDFVLLNRGEVSIPSKQQRREFLGPYLKSTKFEFYRDRIPPIVKISRDGSLGWLVAQVETRGTHEDAHGKEQSFEVVVAWIELYERRDNRWVAVGNASTFKDPG